MLFLQRPPQRRNRQLKKHFYFLLASAPVASSTVLLRFTCSVFTALTAPAAPALELELAAEPPKPTVVAPLPVLVLVNADEELLPNPFVALWPLAPLELLELGCPKPIVVTPAAEALLLEDPPFSI
jgi:hypothetical protein